VFIIGGNRVSMPQPTCRSPATWQKSPGRSISRCIATNKFDLRLGRQSGTSPRIVG
jgi:hypothetical protein